MEETTAGLSIGLEIVSIIALCVSIIVVLNSMYMNVSEKTREIGILRSIGSSKKQVFWLFFTQGLTLGIIGATIGMGAGVLLSWLFKHLVNLFLGNLYTIQELNTFFNPSYIPYMITGAIAGIITSIIGGVFPSLSASRVEIIRSLRPTMRTPGKHRSSLKLISLGLPMTIFGIIEYYGYIPYSSAPQFLIIYLLIPVVGVVSLFAGILRLTNRKTGKLFFMFRSSGKIISRNIERNLLKSTACFTMIGLSLSFLIVIGGVQLGVVTGIEDVVKSYVSCDITVLSNSNLSRTFSQNLTNLKDGSLIKNATPTLIIPEKTILINNNSDTKTTVTIVAIDAETYPSIMPMIFSQETPTDVFDKLNSNNSIILTAPLASSLNVSIDEELQLPTIKQVEISVTIPNPGLNDLTQQQILQYQTQGIDIPKTINITVPQIEVTYHNFTVVGIAEGSWLSAASLSGIQRQSLLYSLTSKRHIPKIR
jgi:ABC-type lipoprotein release transport system permease subunit